MPQEKQNWPTSVVAVHIFHNADSSLFNSANSFCWSKEILWEVDQKKCGAIRVRTQPCHAAGLEEFDLPTTARQMEALEVGGLQLIRTRLALPAEMDREMLPDPRLLWTIAMDDADSRVSSNSPAESG